MKITPETVDLICQIEYLIGKEVTNNNSYGNYKYPLTTTVYRMWDIVLDKSGWSQDFTYPIQHSGSDFDFGDNEAFIQGMKYVFGLNKLYVGKAIINVLDYLEDRYSLNFNDLEVKLKQDVTN